MARTACVIVAGGSGTRLDGRKPFTPFAGGTLLDAVAARMRPQVSALAVNLAGGAALDGMPVLHDGDHAGTGPVAGIVAGLRWAGTLGDVEWLVSVPADTPFLPGDLVRRLLADAVPGSSAYVHDGVREQYLCAIWPVTGLEELDRALRRGRLRSVRWAHEALGGKPCAITAGAHAFFNVNTPPDLERALDIAAARAG